MGNVTLAPVFCGRDCGGDACPLLAEVSGGVVERIRHNPAAGAFIRGCPKGFALARQHYSPERLKTPLIRTGPRGSGRFRRASWDEALEMAHRGLSECVGRYGPESVMCLSSAGSTGALHNTEKLTRRFLNAIGGCTVLDGSYSSNAAGFALKKVFGGDYGGSGFDPATMEKSNLIVLWGANILEARLGAELPARALAARARGTPIVYVDPRKTRTAAALGAEWIPVRPGTDAAMLYAMIFALAEAGLVDEGYLAARASGLDDILRYVSGEADGEKKDPRWAAAICGVSPARIESLALRMAAANPAMLIPGYSIQRTEGGEEVARLCVALQLLTKNFGLAGGSSGSLNNRLPGPRIETLGEGDGSRNPRVPVLRWADAILGEGAQPGPKIHAAYSAGGNFLNQGADIAKGVKAFESLDFAVCHELFMTPTAKHCDLVLPVASPLQKEDIGIPWAGNYLLYKPQALPLEGQERSDYEIFRELAAKFGVERVFSEGRSESEWIDHFIASSEIADPAAFREAGIFFGAEQGRTGLSEFAADPAGNALKTASGKLEFGGLRLFGRTTAAGSRPPRAKSPCDETSGAENPDAASPGALLLITPKLADRVHSQNCGDQRSVPRSALAMNPEDARSAGAEEGDIVEIRSATGRTTAAVALSADIMKGVVSLPEGAWCLGNAGESAAAAVGSANWLTSTEGTAESVSCVMHGISVRVSPLGKRA